MDKIEQLEKKIRDLEDKVEYLLNKDGQFDQKQIWAKKGLCKSCGSNDIKYGTCNECGRIQSI